MIHDTCQLIDAENITIGNDVRIDPWCVISAAGGSIKIGSHVHISANVFLVGGAGIEVEDFSGLSNSVKIYSINDDYGGAALTGPTISTEFLNLSKGKVTIGRHVVVGSGSVVLPSVHIQIGSTVGALSLVNRSLDSWGVYAGIPVRRLRDRRRDVIERLEKEV